MSESGFYAWRSRPPSARATRRAWLTDAIAQTTPPPAASTAAPRIRTELRPARGIIVGHGTVEKPIRQAGIKGLPHSRARRPVPQLPTAADLVDPDFHRNAPNQPWVTDIERHEALTNRAVVKGHRPWPATAGRVKQRAA
ncbi:hypothetical protein ACGFNU_49810 [Spirillospora sp. NPDC048911]|uniref:hypothetical protein n=1 Tax=Spirillospora sp. NPDC048911 TaxID=3364527 RepID=UPI00371CF929